MSEETEETKEKKAKIPKKKVTGDPYLDAIINNLQQTFGKEDLICRGIPENSHLKISSTGSVGLDISLGSGGIPIGRIVEVFGPESSGKTSLTLQFLATYQKLKKELGHENRYDLLLDLEHTITEDLLVGIGVDPDQVLWSKPGLAEEAFQTALNLTKSKQIGMMVLDSIDAAQSAAQLKKGIGENEMGGISKLMSRFLREYSKDCESTETTAIFINQIRQNPAQMFGSPVVTPGGNALKFYSSVRLETMNAQETKTPNAFGMRVKVVKNKIRPPRKDPTAFDFRYAEGVEPFGDLFNCAKDLGIIHSGGQSIKVDVPGIIEGDTLVSTGGKESAVILLADDPELYLRLKNKCLELGTKKKVT